MKIPDDLAVIIDLLKAGVSPENIHAIFEYMLINGTGTGIPVGILKQNSTETNDA